VVIPAPGTELTFTEPPHDQLLYIHVDEVPSSVRPSSTLLANRTDRLDSTLDERVEKTQVARGLSGALQVMLVCISRSFSSSTKC
jgi:hypothetical protein